MIEPIPSLVNPTLPSESDFHEAIELIPSSINPTLLLESEMPASHIFLTACSEPSGQGGTDLASDEPQPSPQIGSFDWDSLFEP